MAVRPTNAILALWPDLAAGGRSPRLRVSRSGGEAGRLGAEIRRADGDAVIWQGTTDTAGATSLKPIATGLDIEPWSPDAPCLYDVRLHLECDTSVDERTFRVGFRRIESMPASLTLNGVRLHLRGVFERDASAPTTAVVEERLRSLRDRGFNLVRVSGDALPPAYLDVADRLGLLVWWELPISERLSADDVSLAQAMAAIEAMVYETAIRDAHHPSLAIRSLAHAVRSLELAASREGRAALRSLMATARAADPTRLVVDAAVTGADAHVDTDVVDARVWPPPAYGSQTFAARLQVVAGRPPWLWSRAAPACPGIDLLS